jgi:anti-anti-sigma regulatory factor
MGNRLTVEIKETDELCYITLSGVIDEDNDLVEITQKVNRPVAAINTANVERINSCGVRDWVTWLSELGRKGVNKLFLVECSPVIMAQVNLVNNFVGSGTILNFYGPYYCSECDADSMLLIDVDDALKSLPFKAPTCRCNKCDRTMEFDDIESSYFAFLNTTQRTPPNPALVQTVRRLSPSADTKLRSRSTSFPAVLLTPSGPGLQSTPTIPSGEFRSLLSEGGSIVDREKKPASPASPATGTNVVLYLVIALLVVAIGLLTYVILRTR